MQSHLKIAGIVVIGFALAACNSSKSGAASAPAATGTAGLTGAAASAAAAIQSAAAAVGTAAASAAGSAAGSAAATAAAGAASAGGVTAQSSKYHVGDTQTVRINDDNVKVEVVKIFDPASGVTFYSPDDSTTKTAGGGRYVGVQIMFTNVSSKPEAILAIDPPAGQMSFDIQGQMSDGSGDESANHYSTGFGGCTNTFAADGNLAPGATATYCQPFYLAAGNKLVEVDWNGIDTDNDEAIIAVP
jgi:hypothetical protein